jgi:hypothetical protein
MVQHVVQRGGSVDGGLLTFGSEFGEERSRRGSVPRMCTNFE